MINRCIGCHYHDSKENVCTHGSPIFIDDICTDYQDNEFINQIRVEVIDEVKQKILSTCSRECIKCDFCKDETCDVAYIAEQLKENK